MSPLALSLRFLQAQPDARLVALARDGHEPAFEALVRRYRRELLSYCRRLQPHSGAAEDALQQTLLQAWRALARGAEVREVRPWLYRIAHNVSLNNLRARVAVPQEIADAEDRDQVEELVQQRLQARAALTGLAALPDVQRQVFISATLDGASHEEVASALGLSSGAVRGLIYRARATLRAAAAAITPSPLVHWSIRRAELRATSPAIAEALTSGGGAGVAAVIAKGGAALTLAGAFAGAGGVILAPAPAHHSKHGSGMEFVRVPHAVPAAIPAGHLGRDGIAIASRGRSGAEPKAFSVTARRHASRTSAVPRVQKRSIVHEDGGRSRTGSGDGSARGGSDGGASSGSSRGSDGGPGATSASSGSGSSGGSGGGSSPTSGGSDGGSSGGSLSVMSGSDGGTSGGGPGPSDGGQLATTPSVADGGSGSGDGSSDSSGSSGSGDTTTTTAPQ